MTEVAAGEPVAIQAQACARCRFVHKESLGNKSDLYCRRNPPVPHIMPQQNRLGQIVPSAISVWPVVRPDQSCGEFKPTFDIAG